MIHIRTKMIVYSMILVLLLNGAAFFLYQNSQNSVEEYNAILQKFFVLNEAAQKTNQTYQSLNAYLIEKTPEYRQAYESEYESLIQEQKRLAQRANDDQYGGVTFNNYQNMLASFLEECRLVIESFDAGNLNRYSYHFNNASKISEFIHQTTLTLINEELTHYQSFYTEINRKNDYFQSMGASVFASTLLFGTLFALWFSNGITKPIHSLSKAAQEISAGKLDGDDVCVETKDEMRLLTETFNQMRTNTRQLILEIEQKSELDQLLKETELKSLQSQINPHFLFNTLNTVSKTAYLEGAERTSDLVASISLLLRYNLRNLDEQALLRDDVQIVREYFFLQKARFGDRVQFNTEIDEALLSVPIPRLTLQPIVENAFIHGIESYEKGAVLNLHVYGQEDRVIVEVTDNGVGMDEETRRKLLQPAQKNTKIAHIQAKGKGHSTGLGMRNVIRRLELFYRERNLVDIESAPGEGTTVRVTLPASVWEREEGRHV